MFISQPWFFMRTLMVLVGVVLATGAAIARQTESPQERFRTISVQDVSR
jgi:hypothetical protein